MKEVNVTITLGDAADIFLMIDQQIFEIDQELDQILRHGEPAHESYVQKLQNRKKSFKELQKKFNL